jgi:hypothetical protein
MTTIAADQQGKAEDAWQCLQVLVRVSCGSGWYIITLNHSQIKILDFIDRSVSAHASSPDRLTVFVFSSICRRWPLDSTGGSSAPRDRSSLGLRGFFCGPGCNFCDKRPHRCVAIVLKDMSALRPGWSVRNGIVPLGDEHRVVAHIREVTDVRDIGYRERAGARFVSTWPNFNGDA